MQNPQPPFCGVGGWVNVHRWGLHVRRSNSDIERSLGSNADDSVHFNWKVDFVKPLLELPKSALAFHGMLLAVRVTRALVGMAAGTMSKESRSDSFEETNNRAHFYVWVSKKSILFRGANWQLWRDYRVLGIGWMLVRPMGSSTTTCMRI